MKAILCVLVVALTFVIYTPVTATASSTTLTTTVPKALQINLTLTGNGFIAINGTSYDQSGKIDVPTDTTVELQIIPKAGSILKAVIYNGCDITSRIVNGKTTLSNIQEIMDLHITFESITSTPVTGDFSYPTLIHLAFTALLSLIGLIAIAHYTKKHIS